MSTDPAEELAALRAMLREATGPARDEEVTQGAVELRVKFRRADLMRLELDWERQQANERQKEGT